jgi:hypothetical protein
LKARPPHKFTPQFGQTVFISSAQFAQYVHSKLQIYAIPPGVSVISHFSHDPSFLTPFLSPFYFEEFLETITSREGHAQHR